MLIAGCQTVKPVDTTVNATKAVANTTVNATKAVANGTVNATKAVANGTVNATKAVANETVKTTKVVVDKFGVYPYEPDAFEQTEIRENKQPEVPFKFWELKF
jgi:hypothetical protein